MENFIKILELFRWPIAAVVIFLIFKKPITNLINKTKKVKGGNYGIETEEPKHIENQAEGDENPVDHDKEKPTNLSEEKGEETDQLEAEYFTTLTKKDFPKAKNIFAHIIKAEPKSKLKKEKIIKNYYIRYSYGDTSAFEELEGYINEIENDDEHKSFACYYLSLYYSESNNYEKAIELLQSALNLTKIDEQKSLCISEISDIHFKNENESESLNIILENISEISDKESLFTLYKSIAKYYKNKDNPLLESIAYQKAIELKPNDTEILFDAAYGYSQVKSGFKDLGLLLYNRLLRFDPFHKMALNNAGVSYKDLDLNLKAIEHYKSAFKKDNSLAASNLAYKLISSGFKEEAEEYIKAGEKFNNVHDRIFDAASNLKSKIRAENELEKKILKKAQKKYDFFNSFGDATFSSKIINIDVTQSWQTNEEAVNIIINKNAITISWEKGEEKHTIKGSVMRNALFLNWDRPERDWSFEDFKNSKYVGYGYFKSPSNIVCIFDIDDKIFELSFIVAN